MELKDNFGRQTLVEILDPRPLEARVKPFERKRFAADRTRIAAVRRRE
jgi:hypothetical protein